MGNGQNRFACETIKKQCTYAWKQEINFLLKNSIGNNLLDIPKRCKQLESSIMEIINAEKEHIQLYSAPNSNVAYNKTVTLFDVN